MFKRRLRRFLHGAAPRFFIPRAGETTQSKGHPSSCIQPSQSVFGLITLARVTAITAPQQSIPIGFV